MSIMMLRVRCGENIKFHLLENTVKLLKAEVLSSQSS